MLTAIVPALLFTWTEMLSAGNSVRMQSATSCDQNLFNYEVFNCWSNFNISMEHSGYQERCPWPSAKPFYDILSACVNKSAQKNLCWGPLFLVDKVFLEVHQTYFSLCGRVQDPPLLMLILFIAPGIIFTLFVPFLCIHLTTWNSKP